MTHFINSPHQPNYHHTSQLTLSSIHPSTLSPGAVPMEYRSNNFGPPLFCNNQKTFYHLDNRQNKSGKVHDTMWLFPRDRFPQRGHLIFIYFSLICTPLSFYPLLSYIYLSNPYLYCYIIYRSCICRIWPIQSLSLLRRSVSRMEKKWPCHLCCLWCWDSGLYCQ